MTQIVQAATARKTDLTIALIGGASMAFCLGLQPLEQRAAAEVFGITFGVLIGIRLFVGSRIRKERTRES